MTATRQLSLALVIGCVLAVFAGTAAMKAVPRSGRAAGEQWQCWQALTPVERQGCVHTYKEIARRADAATVLAHAREFAGLTDAERERLRMLHALLQETVREQPSPDRRLLLTLPPAARAAQVYRMLVREHPERLKAFESQKSGSE